MELHVSEAAFLFGTGRLADAGSVAMDPSVAFYAAEFVLGTLYYFYSTVTLTTHINPSGSVRIDPLSDVLATVVHSTFPNYTGCAISEMFPVTLGTFRRPSDPTYNCFPIL